MFDYVTSPDPEIALQAARSIATLVKELSSTANWPGSYNNNVAYLSIKPESTKLFLSFEESVAVQLLGVAILNRNGYVREAALNCLSALHHPDMLPYLLLRLSDYIEVNRVIARRILIEKLPSFPIPMIIQHRSLIDSLERIQRVSLSGVKKEIFSKLNDPTNRNELLSLLKQGSIQDRLFCWRALERALSTDPSLLVRAFDDPAFEVRTWAISQINVLPDWKQALKKFFRDRSTRVRYSALKVLQGQSTVDFTFELNQLLFDSSKSIRALCRFLLKAQASFQFHSLYESRMIESPEPIQIGILAGYIETAEHDISDELIDYLSHPNSRIRILVLWVLARFGHNDLGKYTIQALMDESKKVKDVAAHILSKSATAFDFEELRKILQEASLPSRRAALRVLGARSGLESVRDMLKMIVEQEELREEGWDHLKRWYRRYGVSPYFYKDEHIIEQIETLAQAIQFHEHAAQKSVLSNVLFLIRTL